MKNAHRPIVAEIFNLTPQGVSNAIFDQLKKIKSGIALPLQKKYCDDNDVEMFAPLDGHCYSCGGVVPDRDDGLITGCKLCHRSFVD